MTVSCGAQKEMPGMLTCEAGAASDCSGIARRDFIRAGALGAGALALPAWCAAKAAAAGSGVDFVRDRSVVLLYLSGGASHIETFNPNMDAPAPHRSLTGDVATTVPGLRFGGTFPLLAKHAHRMAIVRSHRHPIGGHEQAHVHVLSGGTDPRGDAKSGFSIGSLSSRLGGASHPATGLPTYAVLTETEVDGQYRNEQGRLLEGSWPGELGPQYAPFEHRGGGDDSNDRKGKGRRAGVHRGGLVDDMELRFPIERLDNRRSLLASLDAFRERLDAGSALAAADEYRVCPTHPTAIWRRQAPPRW
jgi:hypothetical protein